LRSTSGADAAKAPAANGQRPAPAKPTGPGESGPDTATPPRDRGRANSGGHGRAERADRDRAAAQAAWTWRRHWYRPWSAPEVKVPPAPKPEVPTAVAKGGATEPPAGE